MTLTAQPANFPVGTNRALPPRLPPVFWRSEELVAALRSQLMGRVIRAYRRHRFWGRDGLSQLELARWTGVHQSQLSRIERAQRPMRDLDQLIVWARRLGIPEELLWFKLPGWQDDGPGPRLPLEQAERLMWGGSGLALRDVRLDDEVAVARWWADADWACWGGETEPDVRQFLRSAVRSARSTARSVYEFAVVLPYDDVVGVARLRVDSTEHERADIGYVLGPGWWDDQVAVGVVEGLAELAFDSLGLHRVSAHCRHDAVEGAGRVLTEAGFRPEGRLGDYLRIGGRWHDTVLYGRLADHVSQQALSVDV